MRPAHLDLSLPAVATSLQQALQSTTLPSPVAFWAIIVDVARFMNRRFGLWHHDLGDLPAIYQCNGTHVSETLDICFHGHECGASADCRW